MKKKSPYFCAFFVCLLAVSCSTTGTTWDNTIPPEQTAKIAFWQFEPTSYNQIPVNKRDFRIVTIPAGTAGFTGDVAWFSYGGNVRYNFTAKDASFSCTLDGGREYTAWTGAEYDEEEKVRVWGIFLYYEIKTVGYPSKDNLIRFIPFDPPVLSN